MIKLYRKKKNGGLYELLSTAIDVTDSRNGLEVVIYRPHGMVGVAPLYVSDRMEFEQKFEREENAGLTPNADVTGHAELLAAIKSFLFEFGDKADSATVAKARAAIAKATGLT